MKKLLIIDRYFYPDLQATSVLLTDLACKLSSSFDITVFCGAPSEFKDKRRSVSVAKNLKIVRLPATNFNQHHVLSRIVNYVTFLSVVPVAVLFSRQVDVIMVQTTPPLLSFVVALASRIRKIPFVYVCQDLFPYTATKSGLVKETAFIRLLARLNGFAIRQANKLVALGEDMKKRLVECGAYEVRIEVIQNWTDLDQIKPCNKQNAFSRENDLEKPFVVMHAGNFGYVQDFDYILEIAKAIDPKQGIRFVFVGGGPVKDKVVNKAIRLKHVRFIPFQERASVAEVLGSADVQLVSLKRGLCGYSVPSKIYALLASGRPIMGLVEKETQVARLIQGADCGIVTDYKNAAETAQDLTALTNQRDTLKRWGNNARTFIEQNNFSERAYEQYQIILNNAEKSKRK